MGRLKSRLLSRNHDKKKPITIYSPRNCQELKIPFKGEKVVKIVGKLARKNPPPNNNVTEIDDEKPNIINGVIVQSDFKLALMAPEDLREYAGLTTTVVNCKQRVQMSDAGVQLVRWSLESMFGAITEITDSVEDSDEDAPMPTNDGDSEVDEDMPMPSPRTPVKTEKEDKPTVFRVMDCVTVSCYKSYVELEWEGSVLNDGIADAIFAILLGMESSPAAVKRMHSLHFETKCKLLTPHRIFQATLPLSFSPAARCSYANSPFTAHSFLP